MSVMTIKDQHRQTLDSIAERYMARDDANNWERDYLIEDVLDEYENHNLWGRLSMPYPRDKLKDYLKEVDELNDYKHETAGARIGLGALAGVVGGGAGLYISDELGTALYGLLPVATTALSSYATAKATLYASVTQPLNKVKETTAEVLSYETQDSLEDMADQSNVSGGELSLDEDLTSGKSTTNGHQSRVRS